MSSIFNILKCTFDLGDFSFSSATTAAPMVTNEVKGAVYDADHATRSETQTSLGARAGEGGLSGHPRGSGAETWAGAAGPAGNLGVADPGTTGPMAPAHGATTILERS